MIGYNSGDGVATSVATMRFEAPDGVPGVDLERLLAPVNSFWDAYGGPVTLGLAALVVAAACYVIVRVIRRVPVNRLIALVAVGPTLVWTSHGVWNVTVNAMGMNPMIAAFAFLVFEAMLLNAGYEAERHRRHYGTPGPHGRYVWVIALTTGSIASLGDPTLVGSVARLGVPLVAAGLWWTTLTAPRETDTRKMIEARGRRARGRSTTWAITPRSLLVAAGIMRPGDEQSMSQAERERRIRRMVVLADRVHGAGDGGWVHRRASARLRRLARLATAEDVAEVRARVARAVSVVAEVVPAAQPVDTDPDRQASTPPADGDDNPDDAVTTGPAPGGDTGRRRARRGRGRSTAERVAQVLARKPDATPAQVAARLGVSERTAQRNWPDHNEREVNGRVGVPDLAPLHAGHPLNGSSAGQEES
jgi:hypothetical protein